MGDRRTLGGHRLDAVEKDLTGPLGVPEAGPPPARAGGDPVDVLGAQVFGRERS